MLRRVCLLIASLIVALALTDVARAQGPITPQHTDPTWQAWYWNNTQFSGPPVLFRNETNLDHEWGSGSPDSRVSADRFSARWVRYVDVPPGNYRFTATSDDGIRVWLDDTLIIDEWYDHGRQSFSVDQHLSAGHHLVVVEYYENTGEAVAKLSVTPASATIYNWRGEYFNNNALAGGPVLVRDDSQIDFDWGTGSPAPGLVGVDWFSVRWTRTIDLPAGWYRFSMTVDDGGRLWVNNHLLIDAWRTQAPTTYTGDIYLSGGSVPIKMEYFENSGGAVARLSWTGGSQPEPPPPTSGWYGQYYTNRDLSGAPALVRTDSNLRFDWGNGSPAPGFPADNFSVRWNRDVHFAAGTYDFFARHDDGVRVWVDGVLVIDAWYDQAATTHRGRLTLAAGIHRIQVAYYEHQGQASITVWADARGAEPPPVPRTERVVDNTDPGFQWGGPGKGRKTAYEGVGGNLYWTYNSRFSPVNYGKWVPRLPVAGRYEVFVYLPREYGSSSQVRYRIIHDGWRHDRVIDQRRYRDQWVSLGTYGFNAENVGREFVVVYDNTHEPYATRTIAFDAIKFVLR